MKAVRVEVVIEDVATGQWVGRLESNGKATSFSGIFDLISLMHSAVQRGGGGINSEMPFDREAPDAR